MDLQVVLVLLVLGGAIVLLITEALRIDIVAILVMLSLAWLGLLSPQQAFSGFASNAVIAIIAVMILGYGIDRAGVTIRISRAIMSIAGTGEKRLIGTVSLVVAGLSGLIQNVGATALFLPALMRISRQTSIPASRILMPVGFSAILGGTITMVGSSTLIILNDLLRQGGLEPFDLFAVTPIGIPLVLSGIAYFYLAGRLVLPVRGQPVAGPQQELIETWQLPCSISYIRVTEESRIVGRTREEMHLINRYGLHLITITEDGDVLYAPWRRARFAAGQVLGLLGEVNDVERFVRDYGLEMVRGQVGVCDVRTDADAGFAEVIIRPRSSVIGKTLKEISFRKQYGVEPILILSGPVEQRVSLSDQPLRAGDTLIVHGRWDRIVQFRPDRDFVLVTPVEGFVARESRAMTATLCFVGALALTFTGVPIALALLSGAIAMVLLGVISIDEAYRAVDWRTIFLIAGLIPLGIAMDVTGAAGLIATRLVEVIAGQPVLVILAVVAVLTTVFSLFMSNVAATVLLVPLIILLAEGLDLDPRGLALLVGLCASNSFLLPTHQVNALLMDPGGYHNRDYLKAGGIMTVIFIVITVVLMYFLYF